MIVASPTATAAASPCVVPELDTVTIAGLDETQLADCVMFWVVPSLYVPIATSCCVRPTATDASTGVTTTLSSTAVVAVTVEVPAIPVVGSVAVMVAAPTVTAVATPEAPTAVDTVTRAGSDEVQLTAGVRVCVLPSVYVPVADSC